MRAVDLFAGIGGMSTGARQAGASIVWAGNHWPVACRWYAANNPVQPSCQDLQQADWTTVPPHDLLLASPACQGHSKARGADKPHHDALRATAWAVVACAEAHRPQVAIVENVPEFRDWVLYPAWTQALQALGYQLSPMLIDAADHGVPQHRRRLFIVATRSRAPIALRLPDLEHVTARRIIDFGAGRWAAVRRPGRSAHTLARVAQGRRDFGPRFVMPYYGSGSGLTGRSLDRPLGTITTRARWAVVDGERMRMLTLAETRAAMGFEAGHALPASAAQAIHLLGNAVCPPVIRDLVVEIVKRAA